LTASDGNWLQERETQAKLLMVRSWVTEHWWVAFVHMWRKIGRHYATQAAARPRPMDAQWWSRFVKVWKKIGHAYSHRNPPPKNLPGCEGFVIPDHAPLVPRAPIAPPAAEIVQPSEFVAVAPLLAQAPVDLVVRSCGTKRRYSTEDLANTVSIRCWQERGAELRAYSCAICAGWHLTHQSAPARMREGWRPPKISERQQNIQQKPRSRHRWSR
jgi:hypothetical protein